MMSRFISAQAGREAGMSILEIGNAPGSGLMFGPGLAGTLMIPDEFDAIDEVGANGNDELVYPGRTRPIGRAESK
jgi:hypothetical protein